MPACCATARPPRSPPPANAPPAEATATSSCTRSPSPEIAAARDALGDDARLMVDVNCPWTVWQALDMARELEDLDLTWLEEPVWPPGDHEGLSRVRLEGGIPIAAGENAAGLHDFRRAFEAEAQDIAQPSVIKIGGPSAMIEIAALAKAFGVRLVPHNAYFGAGYLASPARQRRPRPGRAVRAAVRGPRGKPVSRPGGSEGRQGQRSRPVPVLAASPIWLSSAAIWSGNRRCIRLNASAISATSDDEGVACGAIPVGQRGTLSGRKKVRAADPRRWFGSPCLRLGGMAIR